MSKFRDILFTLRPATLEDMRIVFELSNDPAVRSQSFVSTAILWDDHARWFENKIADKACLFLIIEAEGKFAGQIRFDVRGDDALVSVSVFSAWRGKGIARSAMAKAVFVLKQHFCGISRVVASIKSANVASIKFFQACGFKLVNDCVMQGCEAKKYAYVF